MKQDSEKECENVNGTCKRHVLWK